MHLCFFRSLVLLSFVVGCSSVPVLVPNVKDDRVPNQASIKRPYVETISCKLLQDGSEAYEPERVNPLTGFAVGPQVGNEEQDLTKQILRPFSSDGCSSSPDGIPLSENSEIWVNCCVQHDMAYWIGGTRVQKEAADKELRSCIAGKGYPKIGKIYENFVDKFGGPRSTQHYRWGYGWNYKRDYAPINEAEEKQIKNLTGVDSSQVSKTLLETHFDLQKICDTFDPVFWGFRKEEKEAYQFLNRTLKKPEVIEWARWTYYNAKESLLSIKLKNCKTTSVLIFSTDSASEPIFKSDCE